MGDIVVKEGDVETAREVYRLAKTAPSYASWPYGEVLDARIDQADTRAKAFAGGAQPAPEMMFQSPYGCVGCDQTRASALGAAPIGGL